MTPLLLVDGHHLLFRAHYGFPARITSRDGARDLTGRLRVLRSAPRRHS